MIRSLLVLALVALPLPLAAEPRSPPVQPDIIKQRVLLNVLWEL